MSQAHSRSRPPFSALQWLILAGILLELLLILGLAITYVQEQAVMKHSARVSACSLAYTRDSTEWQHCVIDT